MTTKHKNDQRKNNSEDIYSRVYGKILNFLSYRSRTETELTERIDRYLLKTNLDFEEKKVIRSRVLEALEEDGYLNDSRFLSNYIETVSNSSKPRSILFLKQDLYKKGVSSSIAAKYLEMLPEDYEYEGCKFWAEKKIEKTKDKQKIISFLKNKGFRYDDISRAIDELLV